jgi:hypothetical protein
MSNQQLSGSNNNNPSSETQQIRFEDINDEYIAQLLSSYWPQPQNISWGASQSMDIPVPFSRTSMNASDSSYRQSQGTSLPAPPAVVPSQGYHQFTFDELMRQIDRERELALVPQFSDAALPIQTTSPQRSQQTQRSINPSPEWFPFLTKPVLPVLSVKHLVQVPNSMDSKDSLHKSLVRTLFLVPPRRLSASQLTLTRQRRSLKRQRPPQGVVLLLLR